MKIAVLLLAVLSLTAAKPGGYHHQQYSFEQSSASYKTNELQHKNEVQGRYTKFEDLDSADKPPQESSVYRQSEYNAPGADKEHVPSGVKGHRRGQQTWQSNVNQRDLFKDSEKVVFKEESDKSNTGSSYSVTENPDEGTTEAVDDADGTTVEPTSIDSRWGHHGGHTRQYHHGAHTREYHNDGHTWEYHNGGHTWDYHHGGQHRGGHHGSGGRHMPWHTPGTTSTTGHNHPGFHPYPHTGTTSHGSGRDYLENTEGGSTSSSTNFGGRRPNAGNQIGATTNANGGTVPTVVPVVPTATGSVPTVRPVVPTGTGTGDLQTVLGQIDALAAATRDQENLGRGLLDIRSGPGMQGRPKFFSRMHDDVTQQQEDLTQQTQDLTQQTQDLTQQTQDLTQQTQDLTQQTQDLTQQTEDLTQQHQDGFSTLEVASQYQQQHQQSQQRSDKLEDLTQQTQDGFSGFEFGSQQHEDLTQQTQDMTQQTQDLTQQTQDMTQQTQDLTQQTQDMTQQHEDLTQQTQDGFGTLEFGQQQEGQTRVPHITSDNTPATGRARHTAEQDNNPKYKLFNEEQYNQFVAHADDLSQQQSHSGFDKIEVEDFTHQSHAPRPSGKLEQHDDLTQQTQHGFGMMEMGSQSQQQQQRSDKLEEDLTQKQSQDGTFEFGSQYQQQSHQNQDKLDLTQQQQQTQDKLGKLEFGVQHHGDLTQQHEDLTQQHQDGFSTFEIGSQYQQQSQHKSDKLEDLTQQHEDLTQQHQDGFSTLEVGSQYQQQSQQRSDKLEDLTQQHEDLTQQTQDGFGTLEMGSQYQQQSQQKSEDLTQQHADLTQQHADLTQQHADLTQQHEDLTQQTQDGFGMFEIGSQYQQQSQQRSGDLSQQHADLTQQHADLTQQHEDLTQQTQDGFAQLELGQQQQVQNGDWRTRHYQQHSERSQSQAQSSSHSSRYHHSGQLNYAHTSHTGAEETTGELVHGSVDQQHAQQVEDVSQHVQRVDDIKFDDQNAKLEDFNQRSTQEILAKKHEDETLKGHEDAETEKPGFWKRVGSSITNTYGKVKANLG